LRVKTQSARDPPVFSRAHPNPNFDEVTKMPPCEVILESRKPVGDATAVYYFQKPADFEFKAGQFADFTLLGATDTDEKGNTRTFSLANSPHENHLIVATRLRGTAFKRKFDALPTGTPVVMQGPYGSLTLHNNAARPAVFLAGGIGVTPFRSIISQATHKHTAHKMFLFYSVRKPDEAAFLDELKVMQRVNPNFKCIVTVTRPDEIKNGWHGETGHITKETLVKWVGDLTTPIYYIAGPPPMVSGMRQMLNEAGINDDDIRSEEFFGY
jgi:ferredoxin-NADP reductase